MSEIFSQNMKNEHFHKITRKNKIRLLARYVDDILLIYDSITNNENDFLNYLNSVHSKIKFTPENEIDNTINYLDLTITKNLQNLSQTNQQHNSNPQQVKTSIPTKIKHIQ